MIEVTDAGFIKGLGEGKHIVDFSASWCAPCHAIAPVLEQVGKEKSINVYKVDVDAFSDLAGEFGVRSVPTIVLIENGQEKTRLVGAVAKAKILEMIG